MAKPSPARLMVAASDHDPDMLYATQFFCPDPFIFLEHRGCRTIVLSDLEVDRGRAEATVDEVLSISDLSRELGLPKKSSAPRFLAAFLRSRKVKSAQTPSAFPLGLAHAVAKEGIRLRPVEGLFWKERECKTEREIQLLRRALRITAAGLKRGMEVLGAAEITRRHLRWGGRPLTSEVLRTEIDTAVLRAGGAPANTIVAGGLQACDPHERGSGILRAHELIILDVFPRDARSGYFGDMTRTVVRGRATEAQRKLWSTVLKGQQMALAGMRPGMAGEVIHERVKTFFRDAGYPTEQHGGRWRGFFHGTGHGLGLELHEEPRFGKTIFRERQVFTVEPGIYWPSVGGARLEDVGVVTTDGVDVLSSFPKRLEI